MTVHAQWRNLSSYIIPPRSLPTSRFENFFFSWFFGDGVRTVAKPSILHTNLGRLARKVKFLEIHSAVTDSALQLLSVLTSWGRTVGALALKDIRKGQIGLLFGLCSSGQSPVPNQTSWPSSLPFGSPLHSS
jgi:hypothetical protein